MTSYELRARVWSQCCPYTGLTTRQIEKHVEVIASMIERARVAQERRSRPRRVPR